MKINNIKIFGIESAIYGMRLSYDSNEKSDSYYNANKNYVIGEEDKTLILSLTKSGQSHRKFLRCIHIQALITAPFYWWTEFDTYKVGITRLSSSTMHTIHKRELNVNDFAFDINSEIEEKIINLVNVYRDQYNRKRTIENLRKVKQVLPSSFLYTSIIDMNYENFINIYKDRYNHRLNEWKQFINEIMINAPLMQNIITTIYGSIQ